jgi:hypothetical protein
VAQKACCKRQIVGRIIALVGERHVDRHRARMDRGNHLQRIRQRFANVHPAVFRERAFVDRQDGRLRLPGLRLVQPEHRVVRGVIELRAKKR